MARVIIIAGAALAIAATRPADLDAQLVARTGCGSHEIELLLDAGPDRVALALMPLLDGEVELGDLAGMIAADADAVTKVRALYADLPPLVIVTQPHGAGDDAGPPPDDEPGLQSGAVGDPPGDEVPA